MNERKKLVIKRKKLKERIPRFIRQESRRFKKLEGSRRKPRGKDSKMRLMKQGRPRIVRVGYGTLSEARHLHPSGYEEILVYNPRELFNLDPSIHAVRIASTVGRRKRMQILELANRIGLKVLNPGRAKLPEVAPTPIEVPEIKPEEFIEEFKEIQEEEKE